MCAPWDHTQLQVMYGMAQAGERGCQMSTSAAGWQGILFHRHVMLAIQAGARSSMPRCRPDHAAHALPLQQPALIAHCSSNRSRQGTTEDDQTMVMCRMLCW